MDHHEHDHDAPPAGARRDRTTARRRTLRALGAGAAALLCAATLAACGGSDDPAETTAPSAATTASTTAPDNGVADRTAQEILDAAVEAADGASAVHVAGGIEGIELDLSLVRGEGASGELAQGDSRFQLVVVGDRFYLRASDAFYRQLGGEAAVKLLGGHWLSAPARSEQFADLAQIADMDVLLQQALEPSGRIEKDGEETVDGQPAVVLSSSRGGRLFVAATGEPYPLRMVGDDGRGEIVFDGWNEPVELTAPEDAIDYAELRALSE